MALLNIRSLRQGANRRDRTAPNAANYDESKANPYPNLPDPLTLKDGRKVTTAEQWWRQRHPEIVEDFDREVYGRVPAQTPKVVWEVTETTRGMVGTTPTLVKRLVGHVDNSAYSHVKIDILLTLTLPAEAKGSVPVITEVITEFTFGGFPSGKGLPGKGGVPPASASKGTAPATATESKSNAPQYGGGNHSIEGGDGRNPSPGEGSKAGTAPRRGFPGLAGPSGMQLLLEHGWGYAALVATSIQADNGAGLTRGIIGLCNRGQPRQVDDWGALGAWAWGC